MESLTRGLEDALLATTADGARRYPDEVVRDVLPRLVLSLGPAVRPDDLPPALTRLVSGYLERAGAASAQSADDAAARLEAHAAAHPIPAELVVTLDQLLRDGLTELGEADRAAARARFARLGGAGRALPGAPTSGTPARPWAQANLRAWTKDD